MSNEVTPATGSDLDEPQPVYDYDHQRNCWVAQDGQTIPDESMPRRLTPGRIDP